MNDNSEINKSKIFCFEVRDNIGILTVNNGSHNKISQPDFLELDKLKEWIDNKDLKGLIITGKGRHFSAGADVDNIRANKHDIDKMREQFKLGREILNYIESLPMITVAAISGACFGAGLEIALSCKFRICTSNAMLAFPESNIGIMPGLSGTIRLPKLVGKSKALEIIVSGRNIVSDEAYEIGLVDKITPNKEHVSTSLNFISELTENKTTKQLKSIIKSINNSFTKTNEEAMCEECELFLEFVKNF